MKLVIGLFAAMALAGTIPAWADGATAATASYDVPMSGTVVNPCDGEAVAWEGSAHFVNHETITASGHETLVDAVTFQGIEGQGSLGNTYRVVNSGNFEFNFDEAQNEFTVAGAFLFVSEGPAPNFVEHVAVHVTNPASGHPASEVFNDMTSCQG